MSTDWAWFIFLIVCYEPVKFPKYLIIVQYEYYLFYEGNKWIILKLHRMTWYTVLCGITAMGLLLYWLFFMVKSLWYMMMGLGSNGCFVTVTPCLNGGHGYDFASSMGHLMLDSVKLLVYDSMLLYQEHRCCITGSSRQRPSCQEGVKILGRPWRIELWHI
jgi:hypothetical protein